MAYRLGTTAAGKEIEAYMQGNRCLYKIRFTSGGQLPDNLTGEYTSVGEAQKDVDVYLKELETKKTVKTSKAA